jgi:hypothetical protein
MMFDFLKCEYPLPTPDVLKNDKDFHIKDLEFHTFSFPPFSMDEYEITDDGELYRWYIEKSLENIDGALEIKEGKRELSKQDHTGEVSFSAVYLAKEKDFFIEYKALFWKGELKEVDIGNLDEEDNSGRKEAQEKLSSYVCDVQNKKSKWWYPLYLGICYFVNLITFSIRWLLGWVFKLTWKIDRWFSLPL